MGTNTTGGTNDRTSNKREIAVESASEKEIEAKRMENGYGGAVFTAVEMAPSENNVVKVNDSDSTSGDASNSGNKTSKHLIVGNSIIISFKNKILDIINGVSLKVKGGKDKGVDNKKSTDKDRAYEKE